MACGQIWQLCPLKVSVRQQTVLRAGPASPGVVAQGRSAKRQRRSSFGVVGGAGGHLPLAAHSFLLTGFGDQKQSRALQDKIVHLGGYLLDKLPTFQVGFCPQTGECGMKASFVI